MLSVALRDLSVCDRRLEWVGQWSSWWLMWRTLGGDMRETWQSWRRPRRWPRSRTPAGTSSTPRCLQVSDTLAVCLAVFVLFCCHVRYLTDLWISCCRHRGKWQHKEKLSAGMQIFGSLYHLIWVQLPFYHFSVLFVLFSHFSPLERQSSKGQCINHFQANPGKEVSLVNSPTFFTIIQKPQRVSSSVSPQEKRKRAAHGGKKSSSTCPSPSLSSESSCSVPTKDDSLTVDGRSAGDSEFMLCIWATWPASVHHLIFSFFFFSSHFSLFFFQATGSRWNSVRSFSRSASSTAPSHPQPRVPLFKTTSHQKDTKQKVRTQ